MKKILFTGGGSAGHVIPNLALIEEFLSTGEADVCYMGTNGIEKRLVADWKIPYYEIECPKLVRGKSLEAFKRNLTIPAALCRAKKQAEKGLQAFRPDVVFSKGGYVALPVVLAAKKMKIPCFSHESDFSLGLANRLLARKCNYVFTSFPETAAKVKNGKYSGPLLRRSLFSYSRAAAKRQLGIPFRQEVVLIFGGGSGSEVINRAVRAQLKTLTEKRFILHVCGKGNIVESNLGNYRQFEFISDMGSAYACADLVVSRAGSGTVFELLALQKPSLLIPLEEQTRGDQKENAAYFESKGLCRVLAQSRLDALSEEVENAFADEKMKTSLKSSDFCRGNEIVLNELRKALKK